MDFYFISTLTPTFAIYTEGDGNHAPFRADTANVLYARIILSATLFSALADGDARFVVTPPNGYKCKIGNIDAGTTSPWAANPNLQIFGDDLPQGRGTIADGWSISADEKQCIYSLKHNAVIFAGSSLMVKFTVDNPTFALQQVDAANRWTLEMTSPGYYTDPRTTIPSPFKAIETDYVGNVAVLGHLTKCVIQPVSFTAVDSYVNVFFRTEQRTNPNGYVMVKIPVEFEPEECAVENLPDVYYATGRSERTLPLPTVKGCTLDEGKYSIQVSGGMDGGETFGFRIKIKTPTAYNAAHRTSWFIYTMDENKRDIDGTKTTVPFMEGQATSWGIFKESLPVKVYFLNDDMRPYAMDNQWATIVFDITSKAAKWEPKGGWVFFV